MIQPTLLKIWHIHGIHTWESSAKLQHKYFQKNNKRLSYCCRSGLYCMWCMA